MELPLISIPTMSIPRLPFRTRTPSCVLCAMTFPSPAPPPTVIPVGVPERPSSNPMPITFGIGVEPSGATPIRLFCTREPVIALEK
jgi:hypothetical protein